MSLINDALNRARAEAADRERQGDGASAPPAAGLAGHRRLPIWLLPAAAAALVVALLFFRFAPRDDAAPPSDAAAPTVAAPAPQAADRAAQPPLAVPRASSREVSAPETSRQPSPQAPTDDGDTADSEPAASVADAAPRGRPSPSAGDAPPTDSWYHVGSLRLPDGARIELTGIAWSPTAPSAMLNGALLSVGDPIFDLTVVSITERTVTLEGRGRRYALQLGVLPSGPEETDGE